MMNQEKYVRVRDLHAQGWTINEIAEETGWHRTTISKYLKGGPPPTARPTESRVMTDHWRSTIAVMLEKWPRLQAVSVHNKLAASGFTGSYPTVVRAVRDVRGPRFRVADQVSVPIYTDPGEEAQFDFCELDDWAERFGWPAGLVCFGMILSWSRWRIWWFTTSQDREHTFEGMLRFFEAAGGVPASSRTDRMGALGHSQGRRFVLHPPSIEFAAHHGTAITSCKARDAKRKGKVERPFSSLQATFLPEVEADGAPVDLADLNRRAAVWLDQRMHGVESRTTGVKPSVRLKVEREFLSPLPASRFDTDYLQVRRVHNVLPFVSIDANRYSVPPEALGHMVEIRRKVNGVTVEIRLAGRLIATHRLIAGRRADVWNPEHRAAAEALALGWNSDRPDLRVIADHDDQPTVERLELDGDFDVDPVDLEARYPLDIDGEVSA